MKQLLIFIQVLFTGCVTGQTTNDEFIKDNTNNCFIWPTFFFPKDSLSVKWDGECKDSFAYGTGTIQYWISSQKVATYRGEVRNGYPNGKGQFIFQSEMKMEGNFINGILNGFGKVIFPDSTKKLVGNFHDGEILNLDNKYLNKLKKNLISKTDSSNLYVNDRTQTELFYYSLVPDKAKAVIVLFPGTWERVEYVLSSNKTLCQLAYENDMAILVPSINQRLSLNDEVLNFLNKTFTNAVSKYDLPKNKIILGGFSMGGLFSVRYTELAYQEEEKTVIKPLAVYSVDGPTDLESMYRTFEVALDRSPNKAEPTYALNEFKKYFGGTPTEKRETYLYYSTFSKSDKNGGNAKFLKNVPIRIYNDVDVNWWLDNRNTDLYGMNALDQSAMINFLRSIGNTKAEFINAIGKGFRLDGTRHPHSWSIVDARDLITWAQKIVN